MDNQAEIDAALDKIDGLEVDNDVIEGEVVEQEEQQTLELDDNQDDKQEESAPGFIGYEQWVADGRDPKDYRGENAYRAFHDRDQENKNEIKELKGLMKEVVSTTTDWKAQQQESMNAQMEKSRQEATRDFNQAKDDDNVEGALAAKEILDNLKTKEPAPVPYNPVIADFIKANPILDPESPQYDKEFANTMAKAQNSTLIRLTGGNRSAQLTDGEMKGSMVTGFQVAKELYPDKFKSPRNNRKGGGGTPPKRGGQTPTGDYESRLKTMKIESKNPRDTEAQMDVYNMIKAKDPKAAEKFAKAMLGE